MTRSLASTGEASSTTPAITRAELRVAHVVHDQPEVGSRALLLSVRRGDFAFERGDRRHSSELDALLERARWRRVADEMSVQAFGRPFSVLS